MIEAARIIKLRVAVVMTAGLALSAGCTGAPVQQIAPSRLQAITHNQRGIEEQAAGQTESALTEFSEAVRLHAAVENTDGVIVALVNMARTQRLKGDVAAARGAIERASSLLQEPSDLAAEVFFEKAKVFLAAGDLAAAETWAARAESAEKGDYLGLRKNLVASLSLRRGLLDQAREQAEAALKLNQTGGRTGELANSLRLLGEIHLLQDRADMARGKYDEALALDKELCLAAKIAIDLRGLGQCALKTGDVAGAIAFYTRARDVSLNGGDVSRASKDMELLADLYRRKGEVLRQ